MKRFVISLGFVFAIAAFSSAAALAQPPDLTGKWTIEQTGNNGTTTGTVSLTSSGNTVIGTNAANGGSFNGTWATDNSTLNVKWNIKSGPNSGAGWATVTVTPNGHSFNGTWGYNGAKANGSFVGNKILPPVKITSAGTWNVVYAGGAKLFAGPMTCTESFPSSLCKISGAALDGKWRTADPGKVRYHWTTSNQNGWFSFWFNNDGQSFNGQWGIGPDTTPVQGRVVGQRQGPPARQ